MEEMKTRIDDALVVLESQKNYLKKFDYIIAKLDCDYKDEKELCEKYKEEGKETLEKMYRAEMLASLQLINDLTPIIEKRITGK